MNGAWRVAVYLLTLFLGFTLQFVRLPDVLALVWPVWPMLLLAAWARNAPDLPHLLLALLLGLAMDVMLACTLGQHALGLLVTTYVAARARNALSVVPWWQATVAMAPLWGIYALLMTIIDHFVQHPADPGLRWWPVLSAIVLWPLVDVFIAGLARPRGHTD